MTSPSPFAAALRRLLESDPEMTLLRWVQWLNPWYANRKPDGTVGGTRCTMSLGGDVFDDPPTEAEVAAYRENLAKNWVPCHEIGEGVTLKQIEGWLNDEDMPDPEQLSQIMGYLDIGQQPESVTEAMRAFHAVLTVYAGHVTPHGRDYVFVPHNFGTIGARLVMHRFGAIQDLLTLPPDQWDEVFNAIAKLRAEQRRTEP